MGIDQNLYIGPYIVIKSKRNTTHKKYRCSNIICTKYTDLAWKLDGHFCSSCGSPIESTNIIAEEPFKIHDFCQEKFNDCDLFADARGEGGGDYTIVISNNTKKQGGTHLDDDNQQFNALKLGQNVMMEDLARPDWKNLIEELIKENIKFELGWGFVQWWW